MAPAPRHYRELEPAGASHPNLRAVAAHGLDGVDFPDPPLALKA